LEDFATTAEEKSSHITTAIIDVNAIAILKPLEGEFQRVTTRVQTRKKNRSEPAPTHISKREKMLFSLRPENNTICSLAKDLAGKHFLDLKTEDQLAITELAREQKRQTEYNAELQEIRQTELEQSSNESHGTDTASNCAGRRRQKRK
jgi:hypothetical protein